MRATVNCEVILFKNGQGLVTVDPKSLRLPPSSKNQLLARMLVPKLV
jgi:hypothetical protein